MFNVEVSLSFVFFLLLTTSKTKGNNAAIGDYCEVDKNCLTRQMVCGPGQVCECLQGHYASEDNRNCIATTSGICFEPADCASLSYSTCVYMNEISGECMCKEGYAPSEDEKECLADVGYQGFCKQTSQCTTMLGDYASCVQDTSAGTGTGTCGCQTDFHYSNVDEICIADVSEIANNIINFGCETYMEADLAGEDMSETVGTSELMTETSSSSTPCTQSSTKMKLPSQTHRSRNNIADLAAQSSAMNEVEKDLLIKKYKKEEELLDLKIHNELVKKDTFEIQKLFTATLFKVFQSIYVWITDTLVSDKWIMFFR
ncbi:uncharacterized protein [Periplaneta americana]|uniref:uncharacterized protein isoform X2 n=1 Tax=Periplaneta americana TaxID=6978 RepID=UPI0037E79FE0